MVLCFACFFGTCTQISCMKSVWKRIELLTCAPLYSLFVFHPPSTPSLPPSLLPVSTDHLPDVWPTVSTTQPSLSPSPPLPLPLLPLPTHRAQHSLDIFLHFFNCTSPLWSFSGKCLRERERFIKILFQLTCQIFKNSSLWTGPTTVQSLQYLLLLSTKETSITNDIISNDVIENYVIGDEFFSWW